MSIRRYPPFRDVGIHPFGMLQVELGVDGNGPFGNPNNRAT